jgi:hypothetical protein
MEHAEKAINSAKSREPVSGQVARVVAASAANRAGGSALGTIPVMMARSPRVTAQTALSVAISESPRIVAQRRRLGSLFGDAWQPQRAVVQRVKVGDVDITSKSTLDAIIKALGWSRNWGIQAEIEDETLSALLEELGDRKDCEDIVDDIKARLEPESESEPVVVNEEAPLSKEERDELRRQRAEAFGWGTFPEKHAGYRKLGVHETASGNVEKLVKSGPSSDELGKGHGLGKGAAFYVTHVGEKTLYNAIKAIAYEDNFVAIYVPEDWEIYRSEGELTNNVTAMDAIHGDEDDCCYMMSGGSEILIPVRSFEWVRAVASPLDFHSW